MFITFVYHVWYNYHNFHKKENNYDYNVTIYYDKYRGTTYVFVPVSTFVYPYVLCDV